MMHNDGKSQDAAQPFERGEFLRYGANYISKICPPSVERIYQRARCRNRKCERKRGKKRIESESLNSFTHAWNSLLHGAPV